jgi:ribonucleotide reductase alpha subunit/intein/homing endonuclease
MTVNLEENKTNDKRLWQNSYSLPLRILEEFMDENTIAADVITTRYEDVKKLSTEEYFQNNQFSIDAFKKKYTTDEKETYVQAVKRVCDYVASVESTQELRDYWSTRWFDEIFNDWWHPAGSIMQGAGSNRKISLSNCFSRDTEFITDKGIRTFEQFNDGQSLNVMNNYGAFVPAKIKDFGPQRLYKLTLGRHTLKKEVFCTADHVWRTVEKGGTIVEKRTKDLSQSDQLPYVKRKWMPSSGGSRYYCPIGYIHGFVFGDGDWDKNTNTCNLNLCGDSKELIKFFTGFNWSIIEGEETIKVQYLPCHFKSEMPDLDKYNEEYVLGFLIGYFAADGSVDDHGRAYLACAHDDVLLRLKKIVESLGIYCSDIRLMRDESPFDGNPDHKCYGMHIWKDCLFDSFFTKTNHKEKWETHKNSLLKDKSRVNWKVISLEETDRVENVWCVQVPEFHNFTLGGGLNTGNCTTISLGKLRSKEEEWDSLESIFKNTAYTVAKCAAFRQGLGVDFSALRPCGTKVLNSANQSTGAVHWMDFIDSIGRFVGQKGRIPAMLFSIACDHPDVEEFCEVKQWRKRIQNANISVQCTEKFYRAVENNDEWELKFDVPAVKKGDKIYVDVHSIDMNTIREKETGRYYRIATHDRKREVFTKTVKARGLLELIAKQMHANAEPGIQNIDLARKYSNSDAVYDPEDEYDSRILSTNACSEQYLSRESLCVLASANVARFSTKREIYIGQLEKIGKSINHFLDNVNECELHYLTYATPHQKLAIQKLRRTGAGVTNIAAWLFRQNLPYASSGCNAAIEEYMKWFNYWMYVGNEENGKEKGNFGLFKEDKWKSAIFVARMIELSKELNKEFNVPVITGKYARNVTVSSIAPTGCIEENTRIRTDRGLIKIKDLLPLNCHPQEKQFQYNLPTIFVDNEHGNSAISAFYNNGVVDGYVIELEDGRKIKTSETHRIRILKNGVYSWEYAPNLIGGDVAVLVKDTSLGVVNYVALDTETVSRHFNTNPCDLPSQLTEELAEFVGMFTGDGSIKFRSENGKIDGVRFPVFGDDLDLVEHICNLTKNLFGLECKTEKPDTKNMVELSIHSLNLGNFLIKNGFSKKDAVTDVEGCKSHIYNVPELIFRSPKSVMCAYLRGLFETDGSICDGNVVFYSKFQHLTEQVQELLAAIGIQSSVSKIDKSHQEDSFNSTMYRTTVRFKHDNIRFRDLIGFISKRKVDLLDEFDYQLDREKIYISYSQAKDIQKRLSSIISSKARLYQRLTMAICNNEKDGVIFINRDTLMEISKYMDLGLKFPLSQYTTVKVKSVGREKFQTYDIEVEDESHTYITSNGMINHNTLSLMFRGLVLSYGIEPPFFMYFWKRTRMAGKYEYYFNVPQVVREMFEAKGLRIPIDSDSIMDTWDGQKGIPIAEYIDEHRDQFVFAESTDIKPMDKLEMMSRVMKWVDSSISTTYMLPEDSTWKEVYNFILASHAKEVKSIAAFPDKKMYGIVSKIPFRGLAFKLKEEGLGMFPSDFTDEEMKELNLAKESIVTANHAPERLESLDADIYVVSVKSEKFVMVVGLQNGEPYEIFGGHVNGFGFKFAQKKGKISRVKKGQYALELDDFVIEDFSKQFTPTEQILFRMASMSMRHGVPIPFVVEQLQKATSDITSMASAAARVLKKYIKNGIVAGGQKCPSCSKDLVYIDGCVSCTSCGWSKCG